MNTDTIISRVWSFSHILRDDGITYGDYLEQLTCKNTGDGSLYPYKM
jgi:hypothetical protein